METLVENRRIDVYIAQRGAGGSSGKKRVKDVQVTNDITNASRNGIEDPEQGV